MKSPSADRLFSANLKSLLDNRGITTSQLAQSTGLTQPAVHRWLSNKGSPRLSTITKISSYFKIEPQQFFKPVKGRQTRKSA
jgi:transcriptional regulator with XRE-family HTH domain